MWSVTPVPVSHLLMRFYFRNMQMNGHCTSAGLATCKHLTPSHTLPATKDAGLFSYREGNTYLSILVVAMIQWYTGIAGGHCTSRMTYARVCYELACDGRLRFTGAVGSSRPTILILLKVSYITRRG